MQIAGPDQFGVVRAEGLPVPTRPRLLRPQLHDSGAFAFGTERPPQVVSHRIPRNHDSFRGRLASLLVDSIQVMRNNRCRVVGRLEWEGEHPGSRELLLQEAREKAVEIALQHRIPLTEVHEATYRYSPA